MVPLARSRQWASNCKDHLSGRTLLFLRLCLPGEDWPYCSNMILLAVKCFPLGDSFALHSMVANFQMENGQQAQFKGTVIAVVTYAKFFSSPAYNIYSGPSKQTNLHC